MAMRTVLSLAAVAGALCVGAAAAETTRPGIALGRRIGPVSFAEPRSRVTKALGRGVAASLRGHRVRFYPRAGIYVQYAGNGGKRFAAIVLTRSPRYKTRRGVGVGSSLQQLRNRVGVTCDVPSYPSQCQHEGRNANRPLTVFNIGAGKRVVEVALAPGGD